MERKKSPQPCMFSYSVTRHFRSKTQKGSKEISKTKMPRSEKCFLSVMKTNPRRKQNTNQHPISTLLPSQRCWKCLQEVKRYLPWKSASVVKGNNEIKHSQPLLKRLSQACSCFSGDRQDYWVQDTTLVSGKLGLFSGFPHGPVFCKQPKGRTGATAELQGAWCPRGCRHSVTSG